MFQRRNAITKKCLLKNHVPNSSKDLIKIQNCNARFFIHFEDIKKSYSTNCQNNSNRQFKQFKSRFIFSRGVPIHKLSIVSWFFPFPCQRLVSPIFLCILYKGVSLLGIVVRPLGRKVQLKAHMYLSFLTEKCYVLYHHYFMVVVFTSHA